MKQLIIHIQTVLTTTRPGRKVLGISENRQDKKPMMNGGLKDYRKQEIPIKYGVKSATETWLISSCWIPDCTIAVYRVAMLMIPTDV